MSFNNWEGDLCWHGTSEKKKLSVLIKLWLLTIQTSHTHEGKLINITCINNNISPKAINMHNRIKPNWHDVIWININTPLKLVHITVCHQSPFNIKELVTPLIRMTSAETMSASSKNSDGLCIRLLWSGRITGTRTPKPSMKPLWKWRLKGEILWRLCGPWGTH